MIGSLNSFRLVIYRRQVLSDHQSPIHLGVPPSYNSALSDMGDVVIGLMLPQLERRALASGSS